MALTRKTVFRVIVTRFRISSFGSDRRFPGGGYAGDDWIAAMAAAVEFGDWWGVRAPGPDRRRVPGMSCLLPALARWRVIAAVCDNFACCMDSCVDRLSHAGAAQERFEIKQTFPIPH
jgi:hypothetical protein